MPFARGFLPEALDLLLHQSKPKVTTAQYLLSLALTAVSLRTNCAAHNLSMESLSGALGDDLTL